MILISWNIDSLNAALTGTSARAEETRQVLTKIHDANPDIIAIQETKLRATGPTKNIKKCWLKSSLSMPMFGALQKNQLEKAMLVQCIFIRKD